MVASALSCRPSVDMLSAACPREPGCMCARTSGPARAQYPVRRIRSCSRLVRDRSPLPKPFGRLFATMPGQRRARQPASSASPKRARAEARHGAARRRCDMTDVDDEAPFCCFHVPVGPVLASLARESTFFGTNGGLHGAIDCSSRGFQLVTT